jgi:hypothetical protein
MPNWTLKISRSTDITVDEVGNLQRDNPSVFFTPDKETAMKEAKRRIRAMRWFIIGEDVNNVITFDLRSGDFS